MSASVNQFKGHIDKYLPNRAEDYTSDSLRRQLLDYVVEEDEHAHKYR